MLLYLGNVFHRRGPAAIKHWSPKLLYVVVVDESFQAIYSIIDCTTTVTLTLKLQPLSDLKL